jgi:hypothetical protein
MKRIFVRGVSPSPGGIIKVPVRLADLSWDNKKKQVAIETFTLSNLDFSYIFGDTNAWIQCFQLELLTLPSYTSQTVVSGQAEPEYSKSIITVPAPSLYYIYDFPDDTYLASANRVILKDTIGFEITDHSFLDNQVLEFRLNAIIYGRFDSKQVAGLAIPVEVGTVTFSMVYY